MPTTSKPNIVVGGAGDQLQDIFNEGVEQAARVITEGDTQVARVQAEGSTQIALASAEAVKAAASATSVSDSLEQIATNTSDILLRATKAELTTGLNLKVEKVAGKELSDENLTTELKDKLLGIEDPRFLGQFTTLEALQNAFPSPEVGQYGWVDAGAGEEVKVFIWDITDVAWVELKGMSTSETPESIRTKLLLNADTNILDDALKDQIATNTSAIGTNTSAIGTNTTALALRSIPTRADRDAIIAQNNLIFEASGVVDWGKTGNIGRGGMSTALTTSNTLKIEEGHTYNIAGNVFDVGGIDIKFPEASDGTVTYDFVTGDIVQHLDVDTAFASETDVNKVVTERVDMYGLERWTEAITAEHPFVYLHGSIQKQLAIMNGIATVNGNKPASYYGYFTGDVSTIGKGLNWFNLTDAQRRLVASDPTNHIWVDSDGTVVQDRVRVRSFAGAGNGVWFNVDSISTNPMQFGSTSGHILAQLEGTSAISGAYYDNYTGTSNISPQKGAFTSRVSVGYFLVLGTTSRLNQGAYHPSFNSFGSSSYWGSQSAGNSAWHHLLINMKSTDNCFDFRDIRGDGSHIGFPTSVNGVPWGNIAASDTGQLTRPDKRAYDAIYDGGIGGIIDMRMSAYGMSLEEVQAENSGLRNGSNKGKQKLVRSLVLVSNTATSSTTGVCTLTTGNILGEPIFTIGAPASVITLSGDVHRGKVVNSDTTYLTIQVATTVSFAYNQEVYLIIQEPINVSVSGDFLTSDVIGDPANILANDDLKGGWLGGWCSEIPDGTPRVYSFPRKAVNNDPNNNTVQNTIDGGVTWLSRKWQEVVTFSTITNAFTSSLSEGQVMLFNYTAHAYMTEPCPNTEVQWGDAGVGGVLFTCANDLAVFVESAINKVATGATGSYQALTPTELKIDDVFIGQQSHTPISLTVEDSVACKALSYVINDNGQAKIAMTINEVVPTPATTWNDNATVTPVNGTTTGTDIGGNTRLLTSKKTMPLGWIKEKI